MNKLLILLSNDYDDNLRLNQISKTRAEFLYSLYNKGDVVFTLGWNGLKSKINISDKMKKYLVNKFEIPHNLIIPICESRDTVGDAFFSLTYFNKINKKFKKIIVVTSDWHLPRVKYIFNTIFFNIPLDFHGVYTNGGNKLKELKSLIIYKKTFEGVDFSNIKDIEKRLFDKHRLYKSFNN